MLGLLVPVILASILAALRVGSLAGLRRLRIHWWPVALAALGIQLVLHNPPVNYSPWALAWGPQIWVASLTMQLAVLVRNGLAGDRARRAWRLAALGVGINLFVIVANGGFMPQSPEGRIATRGAPLRTDPARPQLFNVAPIGPDTRFAWLGDVIAQPSWLPSANVMSVGDLLLSIGLGWWVFATATGAGRIQVRRRSADS